MVGLGLGADPSSERYCGGAGFDNKNKGGVFWGTVELFRCGGAA